MIQCKYQTQNNTIYTVQVNSVLLNSFNVYIDKDYTDKMCKEGCSLFEKNGGCPPYAPHINNILREKIIFISVLLDTKKFPKKVLKSNYYIKWSFTEVLLTPLANKIGKNIKKELQGYFLASGQCIECKPQKCAVKQGYDCQNKQNKTYSLEATGVLVNKVTENYMGMPLQWWDKKDTKKRPSYMMKVVGVTTNQDLEDKDLNNLVIKSIDEQERTTRI